MKTRMSQDEQTKLVDEVAKLVQEYLHARAVWEDIKVYGCRDPFWEDGGNMNLERNHCIYYRDRIKELCERHSLPMPGLLSEYPIPPVVAEDYMAPHCLFPDRPVCRNKTMQLSLDFGGGL